ncbi:MAG: DNA alkylation repair protein [Nodularia sp. CChRGM 3473]
MQDHKKLITFLQESLENKATQKTKMWWEKYMKGVISFRGVGIPEIRDLIATWLNEYSIKDLSKENQLELALAFFQEPIAEDKLAGILYLQYYLYDQFLSGASWLVVCINLSNPIAFVSRHKNR